jgi:hypothetical protein
MLFNYTFIRHRRRRRRRRQGENGEMGRGREKERGRETEIEETAGLKSANGREKSETRTIHPTGSKAYSRAEDSVRKI